MDHEDYGIVFERDPVRIISTPGGFKLEQRLGDGPDWRFVSQNPKKGVLVRSALLTLAAKGIPLPKIVPGPKPNPSKVDFRIDRIREDAKRRVAEHQKLMKAGQLLIQEAAQSYVEPAKDEVSNVLKLKADAKTDERPNKAQPKKNKTRGLYGMNRRNQKVSAKA